MDFAVLLTVSGMEAEWRAALGAGTRLELLGEPVASPGAGRGNESKNVEAAEKAEGANRIKWPPRGMLLASGVAPVLEPVSRQRQEAARDVAACDEPVSRSPGFLRLRTPWIEIHR